MIIFSPSQLIPTGMTTLPVSPFIKIARGRRGLIQYYVNTLILRIISARTRVGHPLYNRGDIR